MTDPISGQAVPLADPVGQMFQTLFAPPQGSDDLVYRGQPTQTDDLVHRGPAIDLAAAFRALLSGGGANASPAAPPPSVMPVAPRPVSLPPSIMTPPVPPPQARGGGFRPRDLMRLLGAVSTLRGNTGLAQGMVQSDARAHQLAREAEQDRRQAEQDRLVRENTEADNRRGDEGQRLSLFSRLQPFLMDEGIESPEQFDERLRFARQFFPQVEEGYLRRAFQPQAAVLSARKRKRLQAEVQRRLDALDRRYAGKVDPTGYEQSIIDGVPELGRMSVADARAFVGGSVLVGGQPLVPSSRGPRGEHATEFESFFEQEYLPAVLEERTGRGLAIPLTRADIRDLKLKARHQWSAEGRAPAAPGESRAARHDAMQTARDRLQAAIRRRNAHAFGGIRRDMDRLGLNYDDERDRAVRAIENENLTNASRRRLLDEYGVEYETAEQIRADLEAMPVETPAPVTTPAPGGAARPPAATGTRRTVARAAVQRVATAKGWTYEQAKRAAELDGFVVVEQ